MKKLMIAASAIALAGVATAANVFDYRASVKYVDFKKVSINGEKVWVKTVKSTSLTGYLVTPQNCPCDEGAAVREPGFLVLTSSLAKKYDKTHPVKLMPANLLADIWSQKSIGDTVKSTNLEAQGYLFAGLGKSDFPDPAGSPVYGFGDLNTTEATKYLFGQANIEDTDEDTGATNFIEPFLDAAGFGKAGYSTTEAPICGKGSKGYCLKSLSGSVIGGSWSCLANHTFANFGEVWRCQGWNDAAIAAGTDYTGYEYKYNVVSGTWSIKENTKIEAVALSLLETAAFANAQGTASVETAQLVKACGQKLYKDFSFVTFDINGAFPGAFIEKWFAAIQ